MPLGVSGDAARQRLEQNGTRCIVVLSLAVQSLAERPIFWSLSDAHRGILAGSSNRFGIPTINVTSEDRMRNFARASQVGALVFALLATTGVSAQTERLTLGVFPGVE